MRREDGLVRTEPLVDTVARALARPMPRRRAIGIMSATFLAAAAWRPRSAQAVTCTGDEHKCTEGGREICGPNPNVCCNIPNCAAAYCKYPWATCGQGSACDDTPAMCTVYHDGGPNKLRFCSKRVPVKDSCRDTTGTAGWCCHRTETCGVDVGDCLCFPPGVRCGEQCCKGDTYCNSGWISESICERYCEGTREKRCYGTCCGLKETCGFFGCTCKPGYSSVGGDCVRERQDPGDPPSPSNPFRNMMNMARDSNAAHGSQRRWAGARAAAQAPTPAVVSALDALAAVDAQGAAAVLGIRGGKRDSRYRSKVTVSRVTPPKVVAGAGLDPGSAAALNRLLTAQAKANALIAALATALWRARGAKAARQPAAAKAQLRAAAAFAAQAARALDQLMPLRTAAVDALQKGQVAEVTVGADGVEQALAAVKSGGVPPALKPLVAKLGLTAVDLQRLRSGVGGVPVVGGGCLIEPLQSGEQVQGFLLQQWSSKARAHPIAQ